MIRHRVLTTLKIVWVFSWKNYHQSNLWVTNITIVFNPSVNRGSEVWLLSKPTELTAKQSSIQRVSNDLGLEMMEFLSSSVLAVLSAMLAYCCCSCFPSTAFTMVVHLKYINKQQLQLKYNVKHGESKKIMTRRQTLQVPCSKHAFIWEFCCEVMSP